MDTEQQVAPAAPVAPVVVENPNVGLTEKQRVEVEQIAKEAAEKAAEKAAKEAFNKTTTAAMQNTGANIKAAADAATTAVNDSVRGKSVVRFDAMVDDATVDGVVLTPKQKDFFKDLSPSQKGRLTSGNTPVLWKKLIEANTHGNETNPRIATAEEIKAKFEGEKTIIWGMGGTEAEEKYFQGALIIRGTPQVGLFTTGPAVVSNDKTEMFLPKSDKGLTGDANGYLLGYDNLGRTNIKEGVLAQLQWANFKVEGDNYIISSGSVGFFGGKKTRKTRKSKKSRKSRKSKKSRKSRR